MVIYYGIVKHIHNEYYTGILKTGKPQHFFQIHLPDLVISWKSRAGITFFYWLNRSCWSFQWRECFSLIWSFLAALEIRQIISDQILFGVGVGREQITCIHSLVRAERCPCGLMIGRCFLCCICREKGANQNKIDFDSAHLSPVKRLEKPRFGLARKKSPKTYCRVSAIFNQLFFQAAAVLSFALRKWGNYFYQLQWMPRYVISMFFWKRFLVWQKGSNHIRLKKKKKGLHIFLATEISFCDFPYL